MATRQLQKAVKLNKAIEAGKAHEHGQYIYIYTSRENRVVYSLSRTLDNTRAYKQVPFLGKQTIGEGKLRKDIWTPLATVQFPNGEQGMEAYKELREYAMRHLHDWTAASVNARLRARDLPEIFNVGQGPRKQIVGDSKNEGLGRQRRIRRDFTAKLAPALQDQKANSIADLAAVMQKQHAAALASERTAEYERRQNEEQMSLARSRVADLSKQMEVLESKEDEASRQSYKTLKSEKMKIKRQLQKPVPYAALTGECHIKNDNRTPAKRGRLTRLKQKDRLEPSMDGVKIEWVDLLDKDFAEQWPETVEHELLKRGEGPNRYNITTPMFTRQALAEAAEKKREEQALAEAAEKKRKEQTPTIETQATKPSRFEVVVDPPAQGESEPRGRVATLVDRLKFGAR